MQTINVTLQQKYFCAEHTPVLLFDRPIDFSFTAGQYCVMELQNPQYTDDKGKARALSIASAPSEDLLAFSWRQSDSAFKRSADLLQPGDSVTLRGPIGDFVLPEDTSLPITFLIAGIGVTPLRSMLREEAHQESARTMTIFYGNRTENSAPFLTELTDLCHNLPDKELIPVMSAQNDWSGHTGYITKDVLAQHLTAEEIAQQHYYLVGTKAFIQAMQDMLQELRIPEEQIHMDNFG